jgi:hypothetical protein
MEAKEEKKKTMGWVAKTAITIVTIAAPLIGNAVMEWKTDMDNRMEDMEMTQPAAFHVIYENEQANLRQWQKINNLDMVSYSNEKRMRFYELLLISDQIDVERLEDALAVVKAFEETGLSAGEIETALKTMRGLKNLNPFSKPTKIKPLIGSLPPRPNVQQRPTQRQQKPTLLSPTELRRYIEAKKGAAPGSK